MSKTSKNNFHSGSPPFSTTDINIESTDTKACLDVVISTILTRVICMLGTQQPCCATHSFKNQLGLAHFLVMPRDLYVPTLAPTLRRVKPTLPQTRISARIQGPILANSSAPTLQPALSPTMPLLANVLRVLTMSQITVVLVTAPLVFALIVLLEAQTQQTRAAITPTPRSDVKV